MTAPPVGPRLVLDTNVFVGAGFNPGSASARLTESVRAGAIRMMWSAETRAETRRILLNIPPLNWEKFEGLFTEENRVEVEVDPARWVAIPDPDDRKFAALAAAAGAILVTSDAHLLDAHGKDLPTRVTPSRGWRMHEEGRGHE